MVLVSRPPRSPRARPLSLLLGFALFLLACGPSFQAEGTAIRYGLLSIFYVIAATVLVANVALLFVPDVRRPAAAAPETQPAPV